MDHSTGIGKGHAEIRFPIGAIGKLSKNLYDCVSAGASYEQKVYCNNQTWYTLQG